MKTLVLTLSIILSSAAFAANDNHDGNQTANATPVNCDFNLTKSHLCASLVWVKAPVKKEMPTARDSAALDIQFWRTNKNGKKELVALEDSQSFAFALLMPGMKHSSEPVDISRDNLHVGMYHVTHVLFSMGGDWELKMVLQEKGKEIDHASMTYNLK